MVYKDEYLGEEERENVNNN